MMNTKELLKMAKKWQQRAALKRKIISFQRPYTTARSSISIENGSYVIYMVDKERFTCPIRWPRNGNKEQPSAWKRISLQTSSATTSSSTTVEKRCFVVYTADKARFVFPKSYLSNSVFQEVLKISEEEFGLSSDGAITLTFDSVFLEYLIKLIQRRMEGDTEKALLMSISSARCSKPYSFQQQEQQLLVI
ncbi:unnamed protein product [Arabidopsis lyrata]|uniref:Predicted protein n=1 Tax=Arabidopsis lyrata subsp. lyrata TaxID=81972 RepID=D7KDU4_ARALL|nr:predicted protein [Arabidopsis lyrata subsp. lyrata]CAH8253871.1 unnamed protein product [Arabidopsis lyrata]